MKSQTVKQTVVVEDGMVKVIWTQGKKKYEKYLNLADNNSVTFVTRQGKKHLV